MFVPVELDDAEGKRRRPIENAEAAATIQTEPDSVLLLVTRTVPDLIDGVRLLRRQAVAGRRRRGAADIGPGAEMARARIVDHAVDDAIGRIARGDGPGPGLRELVRRNGSADPFFHRDLAPHLRCLKPRPIHGRGVCQDAIELAPELLREQVALPPTGRAAVPIVVGGRHAVVVLGDFLGP